MPKVKKVKARKDYPQFGIKKGDEHYTWSLILGPRTSRTFRQIKPPRPSQLTTSEFLGRMGDLEADFGEFTFDHDDAAEEFLRGAIEELESIAENEDEKYENLPENFQYGEAGQRMEERAEAARSWAQEIETLLDEANERVEEISTADWRDLEEFEGHPEEDDEDFDPGDVPTEDEIEAARNAQIDDIWTSTVEACAEANPGYD